MAELVYGMMQSLDGFVGALDGDINLPTPNEALHEHWNEQMRSVAGSIYGRRMYEVMSYWDEDKPDASRIEREFGMAYRSKPKWVASRTLTSVGPNSTLLGPDLRAEVGRVKAEHRGQIEVAGPGIAAVLSALGLIDEYRLYLLPVVLGGGKPFLAAGVPGDLVLAGVEELPQDVALVRYRKP